MKGIKESVPLFRTTRSSKGFIFSVINLAVFTDAYLYAVIIPVLPFALVERVHLPEDEVQRWIGLLLAAYGAGLLVGSPIAAWFADRGESRQGPYLWGLIALAASTVVFSLGQSTPVLFGGRLIQGASSATVHTVGTAILADTVDQTGVGAAMGFLGSSIAFGVLVGPVIGGVLYHKYGYFAVFVSAYVLVALDFSLRILMLPHSKKVSIQPDVTYGTFSNDHDTAHSKPDGTQRPTSQSSRSPPPSSRARSSSSHSNPKSHPHRHPMLTLLTTPRMLAAVMTEIMHSVLLTGLETALPLRIKLLFNYNAMQVALVFLVLTIPSFAAPAMGLLSDRIGAKVVVSSAFIALGPLLACLRFVNRDDAAHLALLSVLLLLIGTALNMLGTPAYTETTYVVDDAEERDPGVWGPKGAYAQAFSLMTVAYATGSLVGPFVAGLAAERLGWNGLTLSFGICSGLCALPCLYATGGKRERGRVEDGERDECESERRA